jgi:hypothetical protein
MSEQTLAQTERDHLKKLIKRQQDAIRAEGDVPNVEVIKHRLKQDPACCDNEELRGMVQDEGLLIAVHNELVAIEWQSLRPFVRPSLRRRSKSCKGR